jgi:putative transposase
MRDEFSNETLFRSLDHARGAVAGWVADSNHRRPHSALGYDTPATFAAQIAATADPLREMEGLRASRVANPAQPRHTNR